MKKKIWIFLSISLIAALVYYFFFYQKKVDPITAAVNGAKKHQPEKKEVKPDPIDPKPLNAIQNDKVKPNSSDK